MRIEELHEPRSIAFAGLAEPGTDRLLHQLMVVACEQRGVLRLHTLPERMAHRTHKLQFEIVAVLGLIALFTHMHIFWVIGLLLAMIDLPDFGTPLRSMAGSLEKLASNERGGGGGKEPGTGAEPPADGGRGLGGGGPTAVPFSLLAI